MNIIIRPHNSKEGLFYLKPDTTLNRNYTAFYTPQFVEAVEAVEFTFIKVDRAGKGIPEKFAYRYFSKGGSGVALSAADEHSRGLGKEVCNSIDYSFYTTEEGALDAETTDKYCRYIAEITKVISLRTGDIIAMESGRRAIFRKSESEPLPCSTKESHLSGTKRCRVECFSGIEPFDIIF